MDIHTLKHVYFIGIGGIGMSAVARYFKGLGIQVSGYDKTPTLLTSELQQEGINIHFDDDENLVPEDADLVVFTPAIPKNHKGLQKVTASGRPLMKRAEVLGLISRSKYCIAIAGTHGKTTTSTLVTYLLRESDLDPSAFLGGIATDFNSNFVSGQSDYVVLEADEFDRSFLHLSPSVAAILSMDADHLDIYGDHEEMVKAFVQFAKKIQENGLLILKKGLLNYFSDADRRFLEERRVKILEFGDNSADIFTTFPRVESRQFVFDLTVEDARTSGWRCNLPGRHNVENASVAIAIGLHIGADVADMKKALSGFSGIRRRFEFIYTGKDVVYIDDYAHHPAELTAAIDGVRMLYPDKKITGIFQPHLFSRTRDFYEGFAESLDKLDEIIVMDIYPARELPIEGVSSGLIFDAMNNSHKKLVTKDTLMQSLDWRNIEVLVTLGAGDIDTFVPEIKKVLTALNN
jgi:UDP-N-acetylmuramate--alanine ligase